MKRLLALLSPLLLIAAPASAAPRDTYERGVVTLTITAQAWDPARPWAKRAPSTRTRIGVCLPSAVRTTAPALAALPAPS